MDILTIGAIITIHFVADFLLQTEEMANNKSTSNKHLAKHCGLYALPFLVFGVWFAVITGILHFIVDYFSSRKCKELHEKGEIRKFFQVIGLDQLAHYICLFGLYWLLN